MTKPVIESATFCVVGNDVALELSGQTVRNLNNITEINILRVIKVEKKEV